MAWVSILDGTGLTASQTPHEPFIAIWPNVVGVGAAVGMHAPMFPQCRRSQEIRRSIDETCRHSPCEVPAQEWCRDPPSTALVVRIEILTNV